MNKLVEYIDDVEILFQKVKIIENFIGIVCDGDLTNEKREKHEKYIEELTSDIEAIISNLNLYINTR